MTSKAPVFVPIIIYKGIRSSSSSSRWDLSPHEQADGQRDCATPLRSHSTKKVEAGFEPGSAVLRSALC